MFGNGDNLVLSGNLYESDGGEETKLLFALAFF